MIKAVVFDLDDTLYPEHTYVDSGFKAVDDYLCESHDISGFYQLANKLFLHGHRGNIFNRTLELLNYSYSDSLIKVLVEVYRSHKPTIQLNSDTINTLKYFSRNYKTALITDGYKTAQRNKIEALNIVQYFDFICVTDELGRDFWKPHEKPYILTQNALSVNSSECVYIADNPVKDFLAPNKLGWMTIQIFNKNGEYSKCNMSSEYGANTKIHTLIELLNFSF